MAEKVETNMADETLSISEALSLVQAKLGKIPYTLETETTVGLPIRECVIILEKIKEAVAKAPEKTEKQE